MKKQVKNWVAAAMAMIIVTGGDAALANNLHHVGEMNDQMVVQSTNLVKYTKEQDKIMKDMMEAMENVSKAESPSIHFLKGMIPHHQAAIEMSESLLKYGGENKAIKKIADDIIRVQAVEIKQMEAMITELKVDKEIDKTKQMTYLKESNEMFHGTMSSHTMTSPQSVDEAFAEGMIMHHEMAVDMSNAILGYTDNIKIKKMAQEIIDVQREEIAQMKELIKSMK